MINTTLQPRRDYSPNDYPLVLQTLIEEALVSNQSRKVSSDDSRDIMGIQLCVDAPGLGFFWKGAAGYIDQRRQERITPEHPLRIASNTKTFVAAAILRLWEEQRLSLDDTIATYLSPEYCRCIESGGYQLDGITLRHLLTHTSGLYDYADSTVFEAMLLEQPLHKWTRYAQLQMAMEQGKPYGQPGEVYRYSDTGYILLGEILERVHGQSLGLCLRELLHYERLGLKSTWLELMEPEPNHLLPRVHQYIHTRDANEINASCDIYGGGGLVSTVIDMTRFIRGLFAGDIFTYPNTLNEMLTTVMAKCGGPVAYERLQQIPGTYRLGIEAISGEHVGGVYGHAGYLGTQVAYIASTDVVFSLSLNQHYSYTDKSRLMGQLIALLNSPTKPKER